MSLLCEKPVITSQLTSWNLKSFHVLKDWATVCSCCPANLAFPRHARQAGLPAPVKPASESYSTRRCLCSLWNRMLMFCDAGPPPLTVLIKSPYSKPHSSFSFFPLPTLSGFCSQSSVSSHALHLLCFTSSSLASFVISMWGKELWFNAVFEISSGGLWLSLWMLE